MTQNGEDVGLNELQLDTEVINQFILIIVMLRVAGVIPHRYGVWVSRLVHLIIALGMSRFFMWHPIPRPFVHNKIIEPMREAVGSSEISNVIFWNVPIYKSRYLVTNTTEFETMDDIPAELDLRVKDVHASIKSILKTPQKYKQWRKNTFSLANVLGTGASASVAGSGKETGSAAGAADSTGGAKKSSKSKSKHKKPSWAMFEYDILHFIFYYPEVLVYYIVTIWMAMHILQRYTVFSFLCGNGSFAASFIYKRVVDSPIGDIFTDPSVKQICGCVYGTFMSIGALVTNICSHAASQATSYLWTTIQVALSLDSEASLMQIIVGMEDANENGYRYISSAKNSRSSGKKDWHEQPLKKDEVSLWDWTPLLNIAGITPETGSYLAFDPSSTSAANKKLMWRPLTDLEMDLILWCVTCLLCGIAWIWYDATRRGDGMGFLPQDHENALHRNHFQNQMEGLERLNLNAEWENRRGGQGMGLRGLDHLQGQNQRVEGFEPVPVLNGHQEAQNLLRDELRGMEMTDLDRLRHDLGEVDDDEFDDEPQPREIPEYYEHLDEHADEQEGAGADPPHAGTFDAGLWAAAEEADKGVRQRQQGEKDRSDYDAEFDHTTATPDDGQSGECMDESSPEPPSSGERREGDHMSMSPVICESKPDEEVEEKVYAPSPSSASSFGYGGGGEPGSPCTGKDPVGEDCLSGDEPEFLD